MIIIGMLHHRKDPYKVRKAYAYAAVAKAEGVELLFFSPKAVDFNQKTILGYQYQEGKWKKMERPFPDVIYNAGSPEKLKKSNQIVNRLKKMIPFTTHSIGNKFSVYKRLKKDETYKDYLIPSHVIYEVNQFIYYINQYQKIVFKPVNGHKGQGIVFIEMVNDHYEIHLEKDKKRFNHDEMINFIKNRLKKDSYLIQPYIQCKTKSGNAYDFRLHTQKNGNGEWVITAIYPRIGPLGSIVANISSGGATNYLEPFLKQEFNDNYYDIKQYLEQFSLKLSKKMDDIQIQYFNETIDELGIDVGIDERNKIWIFEVNWRPGCPPTFYLELDVVKNMIHYAIYIAKRKSNSKEE